MEEYVKKYMGDKGHSSSHTENTLLRNLKRIEKVFSTPFEKWKVSDYSNPEKVLEELSDLYKLNTVIVTISALKMWLTSKDAPAKLLDKYETELSKLIKEKEEIVYEQKKTPTEEKLGDYFRWPKLEQATKEYLRENSKDARGESLRDLTALALFTLQPPARLGNYLDMEIVNDGEDDGKDNYLVLEDGAPDRFVFNKYKTAKYLGRTEMKIHSNLLADILTDYLEQLAEKESPDGILFPGWKSTDLSNALKRTTKKYLPVGITLNPLRHSYLSHFLSQNPSINDKKKIANLMGQTYDVPRAEKYARL